MSARATRFLGIISIFAAIFIVGILAVSLEAHKPAEKRHNTTIWVGLGICGLVMVFAIMFVVMVLLNEFKST